MRQFIVLLFFLLISFQLFAQDICRFKDTREFRAAINSQEVKLLLKKQNPSTFSSFENKMIFTMMQKTHFEPVTFNEAMELFYEQISDGEIAYYTNGKFKVALVRYWPGDTEVGAFIDPTNLNLKVLAIISDGEIYCL